MPGSFKRDFGAVTRQFETGVLEVKERGFQREHPYVPRVICSPFFPKRVLCSPVAIHTGEHRTLFGKSGEHRTLFWEKGPIFTAIYQSSKIFKLWRDIRVMTANRRSTAWPLSDICNVTANQRSTVKLSAVQSGVNCSMKEKLIVAVCDSRSSIYNSI